MVKTFHYVLSILLLLVGLSACNTGRKTLSNNSVKNTPTSSTTSKGYLQESNLYFEAEKAKMTGDLNVAIALYKTLVESFPSNASAHFNLGRLYFSKQETSNAEKHAEAAYRIDPNNKYYVDFYSQVLLYLKKNKQAESLINSLVDSNPKDDDYLYKKAMMHLRNKEMDKAMQAFDELEKRVGLIEELVVQRKNIYLSMGKFEQAAKEVEKLRTAYPESTQYIVMLIDIYDQSKLTNKSNELYELLETDYIEDPMAQVALAEYYLNKKEMSKYHSFMQRVMQNKNLDVETKIGLLVPSLQKLDNAKEDEITRVIELAKGIYTEAPDNKDAISLLADLLHFNRKDQEAKYYYNKYLAIIQSNYTIWNQLISIYLEEEKPDSVLYLSNKALEVFPNEPLLYFYKGIVYQQTKEYPQALKSFTSCLELHPENPALIIQLYSSLGDLFHQQKEYKKSDSMFEKALSLAPDEPGTLNNYAYFLSLRKENLQKAEQMSRRSLELSPDSKSFLDTYAWILYQLGRYTEAKKYMDKAFIASGDTIDATLLEHMGDIFFQLGEKENAIKYWKQALETDKDNTLLQKKIKDRTLYEE